MLVEPGHVVFLFTYICECSTLAVFFETLVCGRERGPVKLDDILGALALLASSGFRGNGKRVFAKIDKFFGKNRDSLA